jgi:hypothetical protein
MAHRKKGPRTIGGLVKAGWTPSAIAARAGLSGPGSVFRVMRGEWINLRNARKLERAWPGLSLDGIADEIEENERRPARRG